MISFITSGESHGKEILGVIDGFPANLYVNIDYINNELKRRQQGYGRSERMKMENDKIEILSGVNKNYTTGNPISFTIENKGYKKNMDSITKPRPGHADLAGTIKYGHNDIRNVLERASARETATRVAIGGLCKLLLKELDIYIYSHVIEIGGIKSSKNIYDKLTLEELQLADDSLLRVLDKDSEKLMIKKINDAKKVGDTLGGIVEVIAINVPVGLGSYVQWDRRLDGRIAKSIMSIPGIKGVEIGKGFGSSKSLGSEIHDEIFYKKGYYRGSNNAGGIEGGVSNGENIIVRTVMKPIPTLKKPLKSVDIKSKEDTVAQVERSDIIAVPSLSIVAEAMLAYTIANEIVIKFSGDDLKEIKRNFVNYKNSIDSR
ncbi:MAG TPA: chorismate synthase [Tissierellales bacterium]|nr:chorismate synthase [Tissierellales bacterium]